MPADVHATLPRRETWRRGSCCRGLFRRHDATSSTTIGDSAGAASAATAATADAAVLWQNAFGADLLRRQRRSGSPGSSRATRSGAGDRTAQQPAHDRLPEDREAEAARAGRRGRVRVRHRPTDRLAMKVMLKGDMIARGKIQRALTEHAVLSTARHRSSSASTKPSTTRKLYLAMEYCAGGEFFRMLQRHPTIAWASR